jgi:hypothetical protein
MALNLLRNARLFASTVLQGVSSTGTIGSISGSGPWTATITGMYSTAGFTVGSVITSATGTLTGGGVAVVTSIVSSTSLTYTATGGTTPIAGAATNIYTSSTTLNEANTWEIPLLNDFSYSQAAETADITVSEAGASPVRGGLRFTNALNPVEWTMSTYMRPYKLPTTTGSVATFTAAGTVATAAQGRTFYNITSNAGTGTPVTVNVAIGSAATVYSSSVTVTLVDGGSGWAGTNTITVPGSLLGGVNTTNDLTLTVSTVTTRTGQHRMLDRILWHGLVSPDQGPNWVSNTEASGDTTSFDVDFSASNTHKFSTLYFYIKADSVWYRIAGVQVNQAEVDFSIDTIGQVTWSGFGLTLAKLDMAPVGTSTTGIRIAEYSSPVALSGLASAFDMDYIIQKYTTLVIRDNRNASFGATHAQKYYYIPITGGSLTINNNITYLTPELLGVVNTPIGSFTGTREITGSVSAYLKTGGSGTGNTGTSTDGYDVGKFLEDMLSNTSETTTSYNISFTAGGASASVTDPIVNFNIPNAHISIPTVDVQDVLSATIDFKVIPSGTQNGTTGNYPGDLEATNEMTIVCKGITTTATTTNNN